jgi:hypothetical protein
VAGERSNLTAPSLNHLAVFETPPHLSTGVPARAILARCAPAKHDQHMPTASAPLERTITGSGEIAFLAAVTGNYRAG